MKKLIITLLFVIPFVLLSYCQGDEEAQSRESMAVDATETQWSFQLASTESYKNDRIETSVIGKNSMSAAPTTEGSWLKDPITGCGVWNSAPKGNEMISWSGECQDGKASGYGVLGVA